MKAKPVLLTSIMVFGLLSPGSMSSAQDAPKKFRLILSGGYGTIRGGDVPPVMEGMNAAVRDLAALADLTVAEVLEPANWGSELEAEILFQPARNFGLSFGSGVIRKKETTRLVAEQNGSAVITAGWTATYQVIPLKLSGYYFLDVGPKMTAYAKAGIGYYLGRTTFLTRDEMAFLGSAAWDQNDGEATAGGFGLHGGLGLEYPLSPAVAVFIEAAGRYVNLENWSVENDHSDPWEKVHQTGTFWRADELLEATGEYYASLQLFEDMPSGPGFRNVREAAFGFSGFTLKAGMKISF